MDASNLADLYELPRKGRNLARDPRCSISLATDEFDVTVEGEAHVVRDPEVVAARCRDWAQDWPCEVDESGTALTASFSAPSAGPPRAGASERSLAS